MIIDVLKVHAERATAWLSLKALKWLIVPSLFGWAIASLAAVAGAPNLGGALGVFAATGLIGYMARRAWQKRQPKVQADDLPNVHSHIAMGTFMQKPSFKAEPWLDAAAQHSQVFIGLSYRQGKGKKEPARVRDVPMTISPDQARKNHMAIIGASGTGKTVITTALLVQAMQAGDAAVVIDPKNDEFAPGILAREAQKLNRPFAFIDLRKDVAQVNVFQGCTKAECEVLVNTALQLENSGDPAVDFYRGEDRDACATLLDNLTEAQFNLREMVSIGADLDEVTSRQNFWRALRDMARLGAFDTAAGPNLASIIEAGGLVYIVGSVDDLRVVAAQKMLLTRIVQIIKNRNRNGAKHVHLFLDEFKYSLGQTSLRALGTIRDQRATVYLAFQSYGDLHDSGSLPAKAVLGAAKGNTSLKLVFRLEDDETAKELSSLSGKYAVDMETTGKTTNADGLEQGQYFRQLRENVTPDMLSTAMPKPASAADAPVFWMFGNGAPVLLAAGYMTPGKTPAITPAQAIAREGHAVDPTKAQSLI
uniref:Type IV secretion system coupling protein TraD DNA-binding domain-containing protein n=1 Tax=mine drainage metagenome TaxID=410659 RepID=E6PPZ5_9ZZZZ